MGPCPSVYWSLRVRVLHVIPSLAARVGGTATFVLDTCLTLEAHGISTSIFATDQGHAPTTRLTSRMTAGDLASCMRSLDVTLFTSRWPHRLAYSPELSAALEKEVARFDIVHIHNLFLFPQFAAARAARRAGVSYLVSLHGALDPYLRKRGRVRKAFNDALWQTRMLEGARAIHLLTEVEKQQTADIAPNVPRAVVPSGIFVENFATPVDPSLFRRAYLGGGSGPLVLYVGRISHKKGLDILVEAFAAVHHAFPRSRLAIVGPDDECLTPGLQARARRHGIADQVIFTGPVYGDELRSALAACDAWVLASHTENFGIAVVEALAAGCPVISSPGVGVASAMAKARAGLVVELDPSAFARAISSVLGDKVLARRLRTRALKHAQLYDWRTVGDRFTRLYEDLLSCPPPVPDARSSLRRGGAPNGPPGC